MSKKAYERLNDIVMAIIYSPLLLVSAYFEVRKAREIRINRARGDEDDDTIEEWEQMTSHLDFEADGWSKRVESAKSNLDVDPAVAEVRKLKEEMEKLKSMIEQLHQAVSTSKAEGATS